MVLGILLIWKMTDSIRTEHQPCSWVKFAFRYWCSSPSSVSLNHSFWQWVSCRLSIRHNQAIFHKAIIGTIEILITSSIWVSFRRYSYHLVHSDYIQWLYLRRDSHLTWQKYSCRWNSQMATESCSYVQQLTHDISIYVFMTAIQNVQRLLNDWKICGHCNICHYNPDQNSRMKLLELVANACAHSWIWNPFVRITLIQLTYMTVHMRTYKHTNSEIVIWSQW